MVLDRSAKTFIAVMTLVVALFLIVNHIIDQTPVEEWWLAGMLLIISAGLWAWMWQDDIDSDNNALMVMDKPDTTPVVREWVISKDAVATEDIDTVMAKPEVPIDLFSDEGEPSVHTAPSIATKDTSAIDSSDNISKALEHLEETSGDDLQRVEGIGPKYADALVAAGIRTFSEVAAASLEDLEAAAKAAGMRRAASMKTWAEQAALAAKGDWAALNTLQEKLIGGRRS